MCGEEIMAEEPVDHKPGYVGVKSMLVSGRVAVPQDRENKAIGIRAIVQNLCDGWGSGRSGFI